MTRSVSNYLLPLLGLLLSAAGPGFAAQADASRGEMLFVDCAACHTTEPGVHGVGPSLAGIFNRKAGAAADYRYSPAMTRSGITWTPQTMNNFIADPQKAVPANRMPYAGMTDARDRADLIAYLQRLPK